MMIEPVTLSDLINNEPIAGCQKAIVSKFTELMPDVNIKAHSGRIDISELAAELVVRSPGISVGFSKISPNRMIDGSYSALVEWIAYIVVEARIINKKRVEKEALGLAIGNRILKILSDRDAPFWDLIGIGPPDQNRPIELKPLFTVPDAASGIAYYSVNWSQQVADLGTSWFDQDRIKADPAINDLDLIKSMMATAGGYPDEE